MKPIRFIAIPLLLALQGAWAQAPASAPALTRTDVKADLAAARKAGVIPLNEEGQMPRDINPKAYPSRTTQPPETRAEVKAELLEARRSGDLPMGEEGETAREINPSAYPARPMPPAETRAQVKAETLAAIRAGDVQVGETGETLAQQNPSHYAAASGAPARTSRFHLPHRKPKAPTSASAPKRVRAPEPDLDHQ